MSSIEVVHQPLVAPSLLLVAAACAGASEPTLELRSSERVVQPGVLVRVQVIATEPDRRPGAGTVSVSSNCGSLVEPSMAALDQFGTASVSFTFDQPGDACTDTITVTAQWETRGKSVSAQLSLKTDTGAPSSGQDGGRAVVTWRRLLYLKAPTSMAGDLGTAAAISRDGRTIALGSQFNFVTLYDRAANSWMVRGVLTVERPALSGFGTAVALSGDGEVVVVGAPVEMSDATGIGGSGANTRAPSSGAAFVFRRTGTTWREEAYLKASNSRGGNQFGTSVGVSESGDTVVVGSPGEPSRSGGVNGDQTDVSMMSAGAAYVFERQAGAWVQTNYLKKTQPESSERFGATVAVSDDGSHIAVAATKAWLLSTTGTRVQAGNVTLFARRGTTWVSEGEVAPPTPGPSIEFGSGLALDGSGTTVVVGTPHLGPLVGGFPEGAVSAFRRTGSAWLPDTPFPSRTSRAKGLGSSVAISSDGTRVFAGAPSGPEQMGAVSGFFREGTEWRERVTLSEDQAPRNHAFFGWSVAVSGDGRSLVIGAPSDSSDAVGINGSGQWRSGRSGAGYLYSDP